MIDFNRATAVEAMSALERREVSSVELRDAQLDRIERFDPALNAVVALDVDRAGRRALEADEARASGDPCGPLHGLPMTVKDLYATEGVVTTSGHAPLRDLVPEADAPSVAALKTAGAIVFGKTNTPEFGGDVQTYNDVYGRTNNPWDPTRTAGGSSGGSAVAVAAGFSLLELGGDIAGSIRVPSHYNGTFGHKPTWNLVDPFGVIPIAPAPIDWIQGTIDLNTDGPIGRSVGDLVLGLDVLTARTAGGIPGARLPDPGPRTRAVTGMRVALHVEDDAAPTDTQTKEAIIRLADQLADAGAIVEETMVATPLEAQDQVYRRLLADAFCFDSERSRRHTDWKRDDDVRMRLVREYERFFVHWDVLLAPIAPSPAFTHRTEGSDSGTFDFRSRTIPVDGEDVPYLAHFT